VCLEGVASAYGLETFAVMPAPFQTVASRVPRLAPPTRADLIPRG
jgi:hypothetical protein